MRDRSETDSPHPADASADANADTSADTPDPAATEESQSGLEALFHEFVRRGASLGFTSFFLTEEAVRRAFSERVPPEWLDFMSRQRDEIRADVVDRVTKEFGQWLRGLDLTKLADEFFEAYEISATVELRARRKSPAEGDEAPSTSLKILAQRK